MKPPSNEPASSASNSSQPASAGSRPDRPSSDLADERRGDDDQLPRWVEDPVTGLRYVLARRRSERPNDFAKPQTSSNVDQKSAADVQCDFCRGNESHTTETLRCYSLDPSQPPASETTSDWQVRAVPNLFPAFYPDDDLPKPSGDASNANVSRGIHEVIIESPTHRRGIHELDANEFEAVCWAYRDRFRCARANPSVKHALLFKNQGQLAGMSREHIHSQLIGLPVVPHQVALELGGSRRYYDRHSRCVFCDLIRDARRDQARIVAENPHFLAFCPSASRTAFETWLVPTRHRSDFSTCDDCELEAMAELLAYVVSQIENHDGLPAYNYILHSSPFDIDECDHYHWHIEIIPRKSYLAGLEWGGGIHINTVAPEEAAARLRETAKL